MALFHCKLNCLLVECTFLDWTELKLLLMVFSTVKISVFRNSISYLFVCLQVGRIIMADAAKSNLKRVSLELGGKSPLIIWKDADGLYFIMTLSLHYNLESSVLTVLKVFVSGKWLSHF